MWPIVAQIQRVVAVPIVLGLLVPTSTVLCRDAQAQASGQDQASSGKAPKMTLADWAKLNDYQQAQAITNEANKILAVLRSSSYKNGTPKSAERISHDQKMAACAQQLFFPSAETAYKTGDEDLSYELTKLSRDQPNLDFELTVATFTGLHCPSGVTSPLPPK